MKLAILSLPFRFNYGHHLQAYALQKTLQSLGHDVTLLDHEFYASNKWWRLPLSLSKRAFNRFVRGNKSQRIFIERELNHDHHLLSTHFTEFRNKYLPNRLNINSFEKDIKPEMFDGFIVGSDQVWRPGYFTWTFQTTFDNAFLGFARDWDVKRIAYAASFGHEDWMYNKEQTRVCAELAQAFDAISVRESSGVILCKEHLHIVAEHVLDPTLLLDEDDYTYLVKSYDTHPSFGNLMTYILDKNTNTEHFIQLLTKSRDLKPFISNSRVEDHHAPIEQRIQPPIEQWLRGFIDADFVITDSFHGTIFCIIFNKPFITLANPDRGLSRFTSLLQLFGLQERLLTRTTLVTPDKLHPINWDRVNEIRESKKRDSLKYLSRALS